jgi:hypothetical protein
MISFIGTPRRRGARGAAGGRWPGFCGPVQTTGCAGVVIVRGHDYGGGEAMRRLRAVAVWVALLATLVAVVPAVADSPTLSWSPAVSIDADAGTGQALAAVSCFSATQCTAVDASGSGREVTFNPSAPGNATHATIWPGVDLSGVSCPAADQCTAVGGGHDEVTFNPTDPGTPTPVSVVGSGSLIAVSCPTATLCMAVGTGGVSTSFDPAMDGQLVAQFPNDFDGMSQLQVVTCVSIHVCVVVDTDGTVTTVDPDDAVMSDPVIMNVTASNTLDTNTEHFPEGVACPSSSLCTLTDDYGDAFNFDPANDDPIAASAQVDSSGTTSVSCLSVSECTSVDQDGDEVEFDPENTGESDTITVTTGPTAVDTSAGAMSVACVLAATDCVEVDGVGGEVDYDPASPTAQSPATVDPGNLIAGVACESAGECTAVDADGQELTFDPTAPGSPAPVSLDTRRLTAVACVSSAQCTAVDVSGHEVTFDPSTGAVVEALTATGLDQPLSLACPSAGQCTAVNNDGSEVTFDPVSGAVLGGGTTHDVDATFELSTVSCPTISQCTAGDNDQSDGARFVTFDPTPFSITKGPTSLYTHAGDEVITALACPSSGQCTAAGYYGEQVTFVPTTGMVITAPSSISAGYIRSLACPTTSQCTAVADSGESATFDPLSTDVPTEADIDGAVGVKSVACSSTVECVAVDGVGQELVSAHLLSVAVAGTGSGTVGASGISCPGTCSSYYAIGSVVALSETPASGSVFSGWSGACSGTGSCTVTLGSDAVLTATFAPQPPAQQQPPPVATIASAGTASVSAKTATVPITCAGAAGASCTVSLMLSATETLSGGKVVSVSTAKKKKTKVVALGSGGAQVAAGQTDRVSVTLNSAGAALLAKRHRLGSTLTVSQTAGTTTVVLARDAVTFVAHTKKKKKR